MTKGGYRYILGL